MGQIFDEIKSKLDELDQWSRRFWEIMPDENSAAIFAQQGYEDKGYGHIERIINNVEDLLKNYYEVLPSLNGQTPGYEDFLKYLRPNLILFGVAAYLHDIGMKFPGIFEALKDLVKTNAHNALHISEIIHNYHHYTSFIVLLEMSSQDLAGINQASEFPYLSNIPENERDQVKRYLEELKEALKKIHSDIFENFIDTLEEFFVLLAILCLLHKEVHFDYVESILRKFQIKGNIVEYFNKWWSYLDRARKWTENLLKRVTDSQSTDKRFSGSEQILLTRKNGEPLDLLFVEALLQYGDKTEITIARLTREQSIYVDQDAMKIKKKIRPLEKFVEDTKYDNSKGFICTDMARRVISDFARFRACRFIPVQSIAVEKEPQKNPKRLAVVIHYLRFDHDEEIFRLLRYHNEKDFDDLGFLEIIQSHLPLLLADLKPGNPPPKITFKKMESPFSETNGYSMSPKVKEIMDDEITRNVNEEDRFPYTPQNRQAIRKHSLSIIDPEERKKAEGTKKVFYETCDLIVPSSFELMAVLNLFHQEE